MTRFRQDSTEGYSDDDLAQMNAARFQKAVQLTRWILLSPWRRLCVMVQAV